MKKLFTLFAALCCMVGVARAEFSDGVKIFVAGTEVDASEQAHFTSSAITGGYMNYDAVNHILYMVEAKISTTGTYGLEIDGPASRDFNVTIQLCGNTSSNITATGGNSVGLTVNYPTVLRGHGLTLVCEGKLAAICLYADPFTVTGGAALNASGEQYGVSGSGASVSVLKLDHAEASFKNTKTNSGSSHYCVMYETKLEMTECSITSPTGAKYSNEKNGSIRTSADQYLTNATAKVTKTGNLLYVYPKHYGSTYNDLTAVVGAYQIKKDGKEQSNPCNHVKNDKFNVTLVKGTGPDAAKWSPMYKYWNANKYSGTGTPSNAEITVDQDPSSLVTEYASMAYNSVATGELYWLRESNTGLAISHNKEFNNVDKGTVTDLPADMKGITNAVYTTAGTDRTGVLYFTKDESSKVGLYCMDWADYQANGASAKITAKRAMQNTYYPIAALAYNWQDNKLFGVAKKSSKWYLIELISELSIKEIGELTGITDDKPAMALASDKYGDLYCMVYQETDPLLYSVNKTSAAMTLHSHVGASYEEIDGSTVTKANIGQYNTMWFDYSTNELYWISFHKNELYYSYVVDLKSGHANIVNTVGISPHKSAGGLFQILPPVYTITAKVADGSIGTVDVDGKSNLKAMEGAEVTLTAKGNATEGTVFKQWSDGNKDNPRKVKVTKDAEYVAEFWYGEGINEYPIWICGKKVHDNRLTFTSSNCSQIASGGSIVYDPSTNVLELKKPVMTISGSTIGIQVGSADKSSKLTIKTTGGDCSITGTGSSIPLKLFMADVKVIGDKKLTLNGASVGAYLSDGSTLTFEGMSDVTLKGSYAARAKDGATKDKLVFRGSKVVLDGASIATYEIPVVEWSYCTPDPSNTFFDKEKKKLTKGEGGADISDATFSPDPILRGEAYQDGTGSFQMQLKDGSGEKFTDIGWFKKDKFVNMTAKPAEGFAFGRWDDDTNWGDQAKKDDWMKATREIQKGTGNETKMAYFYKKPTTSRTWYGISDKNDYFVQFKSGDYGANKVETNKTDGSSIVAGDFNGRNYYIAEAGDLKAFSFSGVTKDQKVSGYENATKVGEYSGSVTDMAYSFSDKKLYVIMDSKLYKLNTSTKQLDEVGKFVTGDPETTVNGTCIAINGSGKKYVLSSGNLLYTVEKEDTSNKKVTLKIVGEQGGNVGGPTVGSTEQSMAFNHVTGELYWGAKDYLRWIDLKTAKSYIAADLGQTKGDQKIIRALHCRDKMVDVYVKVAEDCEGMGTVSVGGSSTDATVFEGSKVSITATPAEGYAFLYWLEDNNEKYMRKETPYEFDAIDVTYYAYFGRADGIENVQSNEVQSTKVMREGRLYILFNGMMYDVTGKRVK